MENFSQARKLTYFAVLTALTVILQFIGGYLHIGPVNLNLTLIPLVICGMILGIFYSTMLGFIIGAVFLIQGITGFEPFTAYLFGDSPILLSLTCVLKTTVAGFIGAIIYKTLKNRNKYVATFLSAAAVPIVNTGIFILGMLIIQNSLIGFLAGAGIDVSGKSAIYLILVVVVTWNFFIELALNLMVAPALYRVIKIIDKNLG